MSRKLSALKSKRSKKDNDDEKSEDEDNDDATDELPQINWRNLKNETEKRDTKEFPFTKCHTEDCLFFEYRIDTDRTEEQIIALEAIFYQ